MTDQPRRRAASPRIFAALAAWLIVPAGACVRDHAEVPLGPGGAQGLGGSAALSGHGGGAGHGGPGGGGGGGFAGQGGGGFAGAAGGRGGGTTPAGGAGGGKAGAGGHATGGGGGAAGGAAGAGGSVNHGPAVLTLEPVAPSTGDFGTVAIGAVAIASFAVTNTGGMPSGALGATGIASPFMIATPASGDCVLGQTSLGAGQSCTIRIAYTPVVSGPSSVVLAVTGGAAGSATLSISGRAPGFRALAAGDYHTCAITDGGTVKCWGSNAAGQLGRDGSVAFDPMPTAVPSLGEATAVAAGSWHTCALLVGGQVACWGRDDYGQLGDGTMQDSPRPVMSNVTGVVAIAAGSHLTCALLGTGGVMCWGAQVAIGAGDAVDPSNFASPTPKAVSGLSDATSIAAGGDHACARRKGGQLVCWGANGSGQVGNGSADTTMPAIVPASVVDIQGVVFAAAGYMHTCAGLGDGSAYCWGNNFEGEVGRGAVSMMEPRPVLVTGLAGVTALAGGGYHTCAVHGGGRVACWGDNMYAQTAQPMSMYAHVLSPLDLSGVLDGLTITAGLHHTCVSRAGGRVSCWGDGQMGQLGNPSKTSSDTPIDAQLTP